MAMVGDRTGRIFDFLPNYRFHLLDVSFAQPVVFNISYGFKSITSPSIQLETKEVRSGNDEYTRHVPFKANVEDITLEQGVRLFNSDFYDWTVQVIRGTANQRRNLLLIQFSDVSLANGRANMNLSLGPIQIMNFNDLVGRAPARMWMLKDCLPVAYKSGSDFDALGNEISMASLTVRPFKIDEYNLGI